MVSTRVVIGVSAFILFLAFGSEWLAFDSGGNHSGYTTLEIGSAVGSVYGACDCPPSNSSIEGQFWLVMIPFIVSPGAFSLAAVVFPVGFVMAVISLFRWKLMAIAGLLAFVGGLAWIWGVILDQARIVHGLNTWWGYGGRTVSSTVWAPIGPYLAIVGGAILMLGYLLSRREVLEYPID